MSQPENSMPQPATAPNVCQKYYIGYQNCHHAEKRFDTVILCNYHKVNGTCNCRVPRSVPHPELRLLTKPCHWCNREKDARLEKWARDPKPDDKPRKMVWGKMDLRR
jgi:hypothetical protein